MRVVTFRLLKPPPWGVVMGALRKTFVRSQRLPGRGRDARACCRRDRPSRRSRSLRSARRAPAFSRMRSVASMISGPMPSPRATVMGTVSATCPPNRSPTGLPPPRRRARNLIIDAWARIRGRRRARAGRAARAGSRGSRSSPEPESPRRAESRRSAGPGGLWKIHRPEELATPEAFDRDPLFVWEWYAWRRELVAKRAPEPRSRGARGLEPALSGLPPRHAERRRPARARRDAERHALPRFALEVCRAGSACATSPLEAGARKRPLAGAPAALPALRRPRAARRGLVRRADRPRRRCRAAAEAAECDVFLAVGTSAVVYPAAGLIRRGRRPRRPTRSRSTRTPRRRRRAWTCVLAGPAEVVLDRIESQYLFEVWVGKKPCGSSWRWESLWPGPGGTESSSGTRTTRARPPSSGHRGGAEPRAFLLPQRPPDDARPRGGRDRSTPAQEVAQIEEPGLAEDASDIERQISQVHARDRTRLQEIEKLRAQFAVGRLRRAAHGAARQGGRLARGRASRRSSTSARPSRPRSARARPRRGSSTAEEQALTRPARQDPGLREGRRARISPTTGIGPHAASSRGRMGRAGRTVVTLQIEAPYLRVEVPEERLSAFAVGKTVTVWPQARPDARFQAKIVSIKPRSEFATRRNWGLQSRDLQTFSVRLAAGQRHRRLRPDLRGRGGQRDAEGVSSTAATPAIEVEQADQALRRDDRRRRGLLPRAARGDLRPPRPQRRGQDDPDPHADDAPAADLRDRAGRGPRRRLRERRRAARSSARCPRRRRPTRT